jgi:hypothetical protein
LLDLADLEQPPLADDAAELADEGDVLRDVAAELAELGVLLDEALHVGDRLDLAQRRSRGARLVLGDVGLDVCAEVAEIVVKVACEEGILFRREDNLLCIWSATTAEPYARVP